ncbi:acyl-CoA carboxylase subunit epsilon [Nocardioides plantarum]|uniref:Acyl-CoA carboxylase subunit epsilon n=1 Tax=Nocardioides plantarum TaxID=29299 RepID=A0ABV5K716_9ACTN|nr:acyl-CoA carboxylase subunit epsilon [Nocardioides plantarum]
MTGQPPPSDDPRPTLRIVNADATPEEIAAVVAVFAGLGGDEAPTRRPRAQWGAPHRHVRRPLSHGAGGWRSSSLPG